MKNFKQGEKLSKIKAGFSIFHMAGFFNKNFVFKCKNELRKIFFNR